MRSMNCRVPRLEWVAALGIAIAASTLTATPVGVTTSTSIGMQTNQSSAQTSPAGAVCSLTTVTAAVTSSSGTPSGTVTIEDEASGSPVALGSQTLNTSGQASFTFALSAAAHTLIAVYAGNSTFQGSTSLSVSPSISSQCSSSFAVTVSSLSPSNTLTAGQQGTGTVTITPLPSFLASMGNAPAFITVSCSGLPQQSTCSFTPEDVEILPGQDEGVTSDLVLSTQGQGTAASAEPSAPPGRKSSPIALAVLLPGLLGLGGLAWARRRTSLGRLMLLMLLGLITTLGTTACNPLYHYEHHGPPVNPPTPSGTYTVTVTGQSSNGVTAITNSTNFTLTVN